MKDYGGCTEMKKRETFSGQGNSTCKGLEAGYIGKQAGPTYTEQCGSGREAGPRWELP